MDDAQKTDLRELIEDVVSSQVAPLISASEQRIREDTKQLVTEAVTGSEQRIREDTRELVKETVSGSEQRILEDMKQFTTATVSQQTSDIREDISKLEIKVDTGFEEVHKKIDDLSNSVARAIDTSNDVVDEQIKDHETRITRLEHKTA